jgi:hypothetical protein
MGAPMIAVWPKSALDCETHRRTPDRSGPLQIDDLIEVSTIMSDKSPRKTAAKKPGRTLKEKRSAKKVKRADKATPFPTPGR